MSTPKVHFIGIGGIGMSGIAHVLLSLGYKVSGSDLKTNAETSKLKNLGATIFEGHNADHLKDAQVVVISSAVGPSNPELVAAKHKNLVIMRRAEMLAQLMRKKTSIVVAGSHGKSTTSAMIATVMMHAGRDPTTVIGGRLKQISGNAKVGLDDWFIAESDESDGSFVELFPFIGVVTNIDQEHMDHYKDMSTLRAAFRTFLRRIPFDGAAILCTDNDETVRLGQELGRKTIWYGTQPDADFIAKDIESHPDGMRFRLWTRERDQLMDRGPVMLQVHGRHNVLNALAAIAACREVGLGWEEVILGLDTYTGIDRRLQKKGEANQVLVIDDYAHHPTEIRATMTALFGMLGSKSKAHVIWQPHRYSRTQDQWENFVEAFPKDQCSIILLPIYAASEAPLTGVSSELLAAAMVKTGRDVTYLEDRAEAVRTMVARAKPGDCIVTMGAGDVTYLAQEILNELNGS